MQSPDISFHDDEIKKMMEELEAHEVETESEPKVGLETIAEDIVIESEPVAAPVKEKKVRAKVEPKTEEVIPTKETKASDLLISETTEPLKIETAKVKAPTSTLDFFIDVEQFNKDTRLTDATLDTCMYEQASLRAYYGSQAAHAESQYSRYKAKFDVLEAGLYDHHRKELAASGEKITEKMVENAVKLDSRWLSGKNKVIEAETIASINKGLVMSLADRQSMLIQLGSDRREGLKGATRILADKEERESLSARARLAAQH